MLDNYKAEAPLWEAEKKIFFFSTKHFKRSPYVIMSTSSVVIEAWRDRLYTMVSLLMRSPALLVAFSMADIFAEISAA